MTRSATARRKPAKTASDRRASWRLRSGEDIAMNDDTRSNVDHGDMKWEVPETIPILPLKDTVIYPLTAAPLAVGQDRSLRLVEHVVAGTRMVGLVAVQEPNVDRGEPENSFTIGTLAQISQVLKIPDGTVRLLVKGVQRIRVIEYVQREPFLEARIESYPEIAENSVEVQALVRNAQSLFQRLVD